MPVSPTAESLPHWHWTIWFLDAQVKTDNTSAACKCGAEQQIAEHIFYYYLTYSFPGTVVLSSLTLNRQQHQMAVKFATCIVSSRGLFPLSVYDCRY